MSNEHGEILSKNGYNKPLVVEYCYEHGAPDLVSLFDDGVYDLGGESDVDLVLEVPDDTQQEPQFKPFDRVLVRENDASLWRTGFYSHELDGRHCVCGTYWKQCIPYEGNQELVGTTNKPKEE